jgi:DnaJ-class molecular chaperone
MPPASIDPLEIMALTKIMDELDYYQLLGVEPKASLAEIRKAFHASSRSYHPDANRGLPPQLREQCSQISKRVTEAYCVLRDNRRRKAYDARIGDGKTLRIQLAEARSAHTEQIKAERRGRTAQGRQFHGKAEAELKRGNLAGAIQHIQMALTFESDNAGFKSLLEELRARQKSAK